MINYVKNYRPKFTFTNSLSFGSNDYDTISRFVVLV